MSSEAAFTERLAATAEAAIANDPGLTKRPVNDLKRDIPTTKTLAINDPSAVAPMSRTDVIRRDASDKLVDNARTENARARKAINDIESRRAMKRAELTEKYRQRAEELVAERERDLQRLELDFDHESEGPLALLRVTQRLLSEEERSWNA